MDWETTIENATKKKKLGADGSFGIQGLENIFKTLSVKRKLQDDDLVFLLENFSKFRKSEKPIFSQFENLMCRFPTLNEMIVNKLNNQDLAVLKQASQEISTVLNNSKAIWIRLIQSHVGNINKYPETWKLVVEKTPAPIVKDLAVAVRKFFKSHPDRITKRHGPIGWQFSPLGIVTSQCDLQLCKHIMRRLTNTNNKNPRNFWSVSAALHHAAEKGHFEMFKLFLEKSAELDVNPLCEKRWTPFHLAAKNGHLDVCRLKNTKTTFKNKNPASKLGMTPLNLATMNGHFDICKLIIANAWNQNPENFCRDTPLHLAAENGHLNTVKLLIGNVKEKMPLNARGLTPLHVAAENNHREICLFLLESNLEDLDFLQSVKNWKGFLQNCTKFH